MNIVDTLFLWPHALGKTSAPEQGVGGGIFMDEASQQQTVLELEHVHDRLSHVQCCSEFGRTL